MTHFVLILFFGGASIVHVKGAGSGFAPAITANCPIGFDLVPDRSKCLKIIETAFELHCPHGGRTNNAECVEQLPPLSVYCPEGSRKTKIHDSLHNIFYPLSTHRPLTAERQLAPTSEPPSLEAHGAQSSYSGSYTRYAGDIKNAYPHVARHLQQCINVTTAPKRLQCSRHFKLNKDNWCVKVDRLAPGYVCTKGQPDYKLSIDDRAWGWRPSAAESLSASQSPPTQGSPKQGTEASNFPAPSGDLNLVLGNDHSELTSSFYRATNSRSQGSITQPHAAGEPMEVKTLNPSRCYLDQALSPIIICPPGYAAVDGVCRRKIEIHCTDPVEVKKERGIEAAYISPRRLLAALTAPARAVSLCSKTLTVNPIIICPLDSIEGLDGRCYARRYFPLQKKCAGVLEKVGNEEYCSVTVRQKPFHTCPLQYQSQEPHVMEREEPNTFDRNQSKMFDTLERSLESSEFSDIIGGDNASVAPDQLMTSWGAEPTPARILASRTPKSVHSNKSLKELYRQKKVTVKQHRLERHTYYPEVTVNAFYPDADNSALPLETQCKRVRTVSPNVSCQSGFTPDVAEQICIRTVAPLRRCPEVSAPTPASWR